MVIRCDQCGMFFDDEFRLTYCPHVTFPANDGSNHFQHHPDSYYSSNPPRTVRDLECRTHGFCGYTIWLREHGATAEVVEQKLAVVREFLRMVASDGWLLASVGDVWLWRIGRWAWIGVGRRTGLLKKGEI